MFAALFVCALLDVQANVVQLDTVGWLEAASALDNFWVVAFYPEQKSNFIHMFNGVAEHLKSTPHLKFGRAFCPSPWNEYIKNIKIGKKETENFTRHAGGENQSEMYKVIYANEVDSGGTQTTAGAQGILPTIIDLVKPKSVCDVGCGTAGWLRTVQDMMGINDTDATAFDFGVPLESLMVNPSQYRDVNLLHPLKHERQYDFCMSIEVAEHLEESAADTFVQSLVSLSPVILFSAAPPGLGGIHHVNERWITYWEEKFRKFNYYGFDFWRPRIWFDQGFWIHLKQDPVLFVREDKFSSLNLTRPTYPVLPVIHPDFGMPRHKKQPKPANRKLQSPFEKEEKKAGKMCRLEEAMKEPTIKLFYNGSQITYTGEFNINSISKWITDNQRKLNGQNQSLSCSGKKQGKEE